MIERETWAQALWSRLAGVEGMVYTARNPKAQPTFDRIPFAQFFELEDNVEATSSRGGWPVFKRRSRIVVEIFIAGTTEGSATQELGTFVRKVKRAIFNGGVNLGGACAEIREIAQSQVLRPQDGKPTIGIGLVYDVLYIEDTSKS